MSNRADWTPELCARLKQLWDEGLSTAEIGRRMGLSKNGVVGKTHRLGLSARPSPIRPPSEKQHGRIRRRPSHSAAPGLAVMKERNLGGRPSTAGEWTQERLSKMQRLWMEGKTALEIAAHFGVTKGVICGFLNRMRKAGWDATRPRASSGSRKPGASPKELPKPVEKIVRVPEVRTVRTAVAVPVKIVASGGLMGASSPRVSPSAPVATSGNFDQPLPSAEPDPAYYRRAVDPKACQFPIGHPKTAGFRFCGNPDVVPGRPYCSACFGIAYVRVAA